MVNELQFLPVTPLNPFLNGSVHPGLGPDWKGPATAIGSLVRSRQILYTGSFLMLYLLRDRFLMSPTKDASSTRKCKSQTVRQTCKPVMYSDCSMLCHMYWLPKGNKWPSILDKLYSKLTAEHVEIASINFLACPISCSWPTLLQRGLEAGYKFLRQRRWCLSSGSGWGGHAEDRALWRGSAGWLPDLPWLLGNARSHRERQVEEGHRTGNTTLLHYWGKPTRN